MFKIYKGGDTFFQWDFGQRLVVEDSDMDKVHFCNKTKECSLVCDVYEEDGLRLVNVPNILLQDTYTIRVFGCLVEGEEAYFAKTMQVFKVIARTKPEDYVYTEEEIKNWTSMGERIEELEARLVVAEEKITIVEEGADGIVAVVTEVKETALLELENKEAEALSTIDNAKGAALGDISAEVAKSANNASAAENSALLATQEANKAQEYANNAATATEEALAQAKASGLFDGTDGKSAYQYALDNGFTGTEEEFAQKQAATIPTKPEDVGAVPTGRKVNNKALSSDITLNASDVGAVPASRTVNGKALNSDVTLAPGDIGAAPGYTYGTADLTAGSSSLATGVLYFVYE